MKLKADMHVHTYYSDGLMSPAEVVSLAHKNGVRFLAVTDHDCSLAYDEVKAECDKYGIKTVTGIEVSAYVGDVKIHTLGYGINLDHPVYIRFFKKLYDGAVERTADIVGKLNKNGVKLTVDDVMNVRKSLLSPPHAMHVANAGYKKGYTNSPSDFFFKYLAWGKPAFSGICRPTPEETVKIIRECGGISSVAHPGRIDMPAADLVKLIERMKECGLDGIEAVYSAHTVKETAYYKELAGSFNLLVTGGSDTHFTGGYRNIGTPEFFLDEALAEKLRI